MDFEQLNSNPDYNQNNFFIQNIQSIFDKETLFHNIQKQKNFNKEFDLNSDSFMENEYDYFSNSESNNNMITEIISPLNPQIKKAEKVEIKKGRRKKNDLSSLNEIKHGKYAKDNIMAKIRRTFVKSVFEYINKKYKEFKKNQNQKCIKPLIKLIASDKYNVFSNSKIKAFFASSLKDLFSSELSKRYSNSTLKHSKYYNKDNIDLLMNEDKAIELIEILNMTVGEMYEKYINNKIPECNIDNDIKRMKEDPEYIKLYRETAKNYSKYYSNKKDKKVKELQLILI